MKTVKKIKKSENLTQSSPRVNSQENLMNAKKSRRTKSVRHLDEIQSTKNSQRKLARTKKFSTSSSKKPKKVKDTLSFMFESKKMPKSTAENQVKAAITATADARKSKKSPSSAKKLECPNREYNCLKDLIEKTIPKFQSEKLTSPKAKATEKSEKVAKSRSQKLVHKEGKKKELKLSADKPESSTNCAASHKKSKSESIFPQASISEQITPQRPSPISNNENPVALKQRRISPSARHTRKAQVSHSEKGTFLSSTLGKLRPGQRPDGKELSAKLQRLQLHSKLK